MKTYQVEHEEETRWQSLQPWTPSGGFVSISKEDDHDLLRDMVRAFAERLMAAEVDVLCNTSYSEVSAERTNSRNGLRRRDFDTRVGSIELAIPKLRHSIYFPDWLLEPRRRAERALTHVVAECYVRGVTTTRVEGHEVAAFRRGH